MNNMFVGVKTPNISPWGIKIRQPFEQYVDWGNGIKYIFMRDQNSPPPMNNMLTGVVTSTLSWWGIKIRPSNNMLIGVITPTISPWGINIRHPLWAICCWGNSIKYIFMRGVKIRPASENMLIGVITPTNISMRDQDSPPPMSNMLIGVIASNISPWGIKNHHPLWTICWLE